MTNDDHVNIAWQSLQALQDDRVMLPAAYLDGVAALKTILREVYNRNLMIVPVPQGVPQDIPKPKAKKDASK